jgi:hypothetical protein
MPRFGNTIINPLYTKGFFISAYFLFLESYSLAVVPFPLSYLFVQQVFHSIVNMV